MATECATKHGQDVNRPEGCGSQPEDIGNVKLWRLTITTVDIWTIANFDNLLTNIKYFLFTIS